MAVDLRSALEGKETMTDDLVKRLKGHSEIMERDKGKVVRFIDVATCTEAADRLKALTAENERLRLKLEQASNNLKAGAKRYECPGLAASARLAFEALEEQP